MFPTFVKIVSRVGSVAMSETTRERVLRHLDEMLESPGFVSHPRCATLLRYLVEQSLEDKRPREIDIAVDVFGKDQAYDPAENSSVRVTVHTLRKMLRNYYAQSDSGDGIRLSIPKGGYRVAFGVPLIAGGETAPSIPGFRHWLENWRPSAIVGLLLVSLAGNLWLTVSRPDTPRSDSGSPPGSRLLSLGTDGDSAEPILIVLGDFFFYQEGEYEPGLPRFTRRVDINSADDLRRFAGDDYGSTVMPSQRSYLPKSAAFALETVLPVAKATGQPVSLKLMSDVRGEDLRNNHIVYVGYLRSMGVLRDYFFRSSNFCAEPPYSELVHRQTGETFARSGYPFEHVVDYGLFARMAGPGGREILIFTGISDVGILHTVRALTDPEIATEVERAVTSLDDPSSEMEVLFEVSGYDRTALVGTKVLAYGRNNSTQAEREGITSGPGGETDACGSIELVM